MKIVYEPIKGSTAYIKIKAGTNKSLGAVQKYNKIVKAATHKMYPETGHYDGYFFGLGWKSDPNEQNWDRGYSGTVSSSGYVSISKNTDGWSVTGVYFEVFDARLSDYQHAFKWLKLISKTTRGKWWYIIAGILIAIGVIMTTEGALGAGEASIFYVPAGILIADIIYRWVCKFLARAMVKKAHQVCKDNGYIR